MKKTTNYQLNQWEKDDRIQMEDFNSDNMKVEQALAAQAETQREMAAALANCGNCRVVYGSYTGTGTYGADNPNTLTLDFAPQIIFISALTATTYSVAMQGHEHIAATGSSKDCVLTWSGNTVSWYYNGSAALVDEAAAQLNSKGTTYSFFAFG